MKRVAMILLLLLAVTDAQAESARVKKATIDTLKLAAATDHLTRDIGRQLQADEWPSALVTRLPDTALWQGSYIARISKDPWGVPYRFDSCVKLGEGCRVYSVGVNAIDEQGHGDDVTSWSGYDKAIYSPNETRDKLLFLLAGALLLWAVLYGVVRVFRSLTGRSRVA